MSRMLDEFTAVDEGGTPPESPARRMVMRTGLPSATLTGATLVIVVVAVAAFVLGSAWPVADARGIAHRHRRRR